jgi:hypothetical protein
MPPYDTDEEIFSPERDIAPYTTNYFDSVENDPRLRRAQKTQLQGSLLGDVMDIELQRLKLQQERDDQQYRRQQMAVGSIALDAQRMRRDREMQAIAKRGVVDAQLRGVLDDQAATPDQKESAIARIAFDNSDIWDDPATQNRFNLAIKSLPTPAKPRYSTDDYIRAGKAGVVLTEDTHPAVLGQAEAKLAASEREAVRQQRLEDRRDMRDEAWEHENIRKKFETISRPIRFDVDEDKNPVRFDEGSSLTEKLLLDEVADDKERAAYDALSLAEKHKSLLSLQRRALNGQFRPKQATPAERANNRAFRQ